jgi:hypothetical protein
MRRIIVSVAFVILLTPQLNAQVVAVQGLDANYAGSADRTYGWRFTVGNSPLSVSQLGYYDHGANGLFDSHPVGIWQLDGSLVVQATVPSGTVGTLIDSFRFVSITPVTLNANQTYVIGGWSPSASDLVIAGSPTATIASEITYNIAAYAAPEDNFGFPGSTYNATYGVMGPNMEFSAVPEPRHYAMIAGFGLVAFAFVRRHFNRP